MLVLTAALQEPASLDASGVLTEPERAQFAGILGFHGLLRELTRGLLGVTASATAVRPRNRRWLRPPE